MSTTDFDPRIRDDPPRLMRRTLRRLARALLAIALLAAVGWLSHVASDPHAALARFAP